MTVIRQWLDALGLGQYAEAFEDNAIAWEQLPKLDHGVLKDIGVRAAGHRMRLLEAAAELASDPAPPSPGAAAAVAAPGAEAERRHLTVLFCDLVGSTALSERLDPEEYRELLGAYQDAARGAIARYEGYIARYMGDGLLVYFGYPQAHEEDAERAVRAGLDIVAAVRGLVRPDPAALAVRVGIATGLVVAGDIVGEGASEERAVLGETPNLAARLQALAAPDTVVVADATQRLVAGRFELEALGSQTLKGIGQPVPVYRAVAVRTASRFEAAVGQQLTPLSGRASELALLEDRWRQAHGGEGQVVLLAGEPGIGKSRVSEALRDRIGGAAAAVLRYQCSPYHSGSAFHPIIEQIGRAAGFARGDSAQARALKLEALIEPAFPQRAQALSLLSALLSLPPERHPPLDLTPARQKAETIAVLVRLLESLAARGPVLVLFEDAHWVDPSTEEVLGALIARGQSLPVLMLITYRPEYVPPWTGFGHVSVHSLNRLGRTEVLAILAGLTGSRDLPPAVLDQIVARADGVPLFVEELTKSVLEAGGPGAAAAASPSAPAIPATLHDALLARLDRLPAPVKEVAQIGACVGREFGHELLAAVSPLPGPALDDALARLVATGLAFRRGEPPEASYTFKHALVQDTAYESLLKARRRQVHARIAGALETLFPERCETQPELLAHHCTLAGLDEQAVVHWHQAGRRAVERSAHAEAIAHLKRGLEVLDGFPDGLERAGRELELRTVLGPALMVTRGQSAAEVEQDYTQALALCDRLGDTPHRFPVLWGLWYLYLARGALPRARELGEQLLAVGEEADDAELLLPAHRALGNTLLWLADLEPACGLLERGAALHDPERHGALAHRYGQDLGVVCGVWASWARWALGYPDRALSHIEEAQARAQALGHPLSRAYAFLGAAWLHLWRGEAGLAEERAEAGRNLCEEQGFALYHAWLSVARGSAMARQGRLRAGIAEMQQGLAAWNATEARVCQPKMLAALAEAHGRAGEPEGGLACIDEALGYEAQTGERFCDAELHRLRGRLLLAGPADRRAEAEAELEEALAVARGQRARSWELRAALDLARLRDAAGRRAEARALLGPVQGWFTEGFETADLREAAALLAQL